MALTAAERMKRYREKLKRDPQRYEEVKKKHAAKVKSKSKKINELTEDEKEKKRKKWREQKRKQKEKPVFSNENTILSTKNESTSKKRKTNRSRLVRNYNNALKKNLVLKTTHQTARKQFYRYKIVTSKKIRSLEEKLDLMKAREELLESSLKTIYKKCNKYCERNMLKALTEDERTKIARKKTYVSKLLGLKSIARRRMKKNKKNIVCKEIETFFNRDDISKSTAGKKECRTLQKQKEQIRYLTDTLFNIYQIYRVEGGTKSFSTFYKYKPFNVLSPSVLRRDTCLCIKHSNFEHLFHILRKIGVLRKYKTPDDIITQLTCDIKSKKCMYGECTKCSTKVLEYELKDGKNNEETEWEQWENTKHEYRKTENGTDKTILTKRMTKVRKTGTIKCLISPTVD